MSLSGKQLTTSAVSNPFQYASKRLDPETGFIAFGLRYYDPSLGRWICPDPVGSADGPNLYAYVHNNPFMYYDQFGLFAEDYDLSWDPVFPTYYIASFDDSYHGFVGALHGGFDFATNQVAQIGSHCSAIGAHEWDDPEDRLISTLGFAELSYSLLETIGSLFHRSISCGSYQFHLSRFSHYNSCIDGNWQPRYRRL